ncbi:hypothetical protein Q3G72_000045 [Acer saccharum]|nr:hypothetical protein Q3G72_000045 [Acer saccharum]
MGLGRVKFCQVYEALQKPPLRLDDLHINSATRFLRFNAHARYNFYEFDTSCNNTYKTRERKRETALLLAFVKIM